MVRKQTFAVVDLETTGTKIDGTNRIIQFSCVLVENNKIVNHFNTLVNPLRPIPVEIQNLTGIYEQDVCSAPVFDDIAGTVYALLQNTVFVAHNIQFDYRFLNAELERVGYPALDIQGIDTVQLSQILFPCLPSYRLQDLSAALKIDHLHPHRADSDAEVTAKLFIQLVNEVHHLPDLLLKQLVKMSTGLLYETGKLFAIEQKNRKQAVYNDRLIKVGCLLLRIPHQFKSHSFDHRVNANILEKRFKGYERRPQQFKLMDDLDSVLRTNNKKAFFEAPTGIGKTLGYLMPAAYEIQYGHRFLISTSTTALQSQLLDHEIKHLRDIIPWNINVVSLKGNHHYIDLDKFARTLKNPQNEYTQLVQMRILVWLSQTETGDLDELNITSQQLPLFEEIVHHGKLGLRSDSPYFKYDFLRRQEELIQEADFVITNHAFLVKHASDFVEINQTLIVDEAQQLVSTVLRDNSRIIDFDLIKIIADTLLVKMESQVSYSFKDLIDQRLLVKFEYDKILEKIQIIDHEIPEFRELMMRRFIKVDSPQKKFNFPIKTKKFLGYLKEKYNQYIKIQHAIEFIIEKNLVLYQHFLDLLDNQQLDSQSFALFKNYFKLCNDLLENLKDWRLLVPENLEKDNLMVWIQYPVDQEGAHLKLHIGLLSSKDYLVQKVYPNFDHVLFLSGSTFTPKTYQYLTNQLGAIECKHFKYQSIFNFKQNTESLIIKNAPDVRHLPSKEYIGYLAKQIKIICAAQDRQTMVLFNSFDVMEKVFALLQDDVQMSKWQILAQRITGTTERIKKQFQSAGRTPQILLATGSFWEGIDLPGKQLETLVITKLPFKAIQLPENEIRYRQIEQHGGNAFNDVALPEAVMRFSQGVGRLIRTNADRGLVITLDSRIVTRNYGSEFLKSFPNHMPQKIIETDQLSSEIKTFFKSKD